MYLVVGLGNPGKEYDGTRHNLGFEVISEIKRRLEVETPFKQNLKSMIGKSCLDSKDLILAMPQTFMNNSGYAVKQIKDKYNIDVKKIIAVYDDMDLESGRIKIKLGGSSGGHNGVESIINSLGTKDFIRVKIGINRPAVFKKEENHYADYVLSKIPKSQKKEISESIGKAADAVEYVIIKGPHLAMNIFNKNI